jgi:hypothetical protein
MLQAVTVEILAKQGGAAMSENLERQTAIHEFGQTLTRLLASQARNTAPGERDAPVDPGVPVKSEELLNCFLRKKPEFVRFRKALADSISTSNQYSLNKDRWVNYRNES